EKASTPTTSRLLKNEMPIKEHRLHFCEERIATIQVSPPRLHHSNIRIREIVNHLMQDVRRRNEVRVENKDQVAGSRLHPCFQGARLKPGPIHPMANVDVESFSPESFGFFLT